jgi:hypothetical protein
MPDKYMLQDGINVYQEAGGIVIENERNLGSSNRYLKLGAQACQNLLDFLAGNTNDSGYKTDSAAEQIRAADQHEQNGELQCISVVSIDMHTFLDGDKCIYCGAPRSNRSVGA